MIGGTLAIESRPVRARASKCGCRARPMDKTKVVIADDHPILRDGLRKLLEAEQDFAVVGEAVDGHGAVEVTRRIEPNILLLDLAMPGLPGLEVLRALNGVPLATRTILLTANIERDEVVKALQLGARGLVMKDSASELLMKAMRMVMAGQYWIGRESVSGLVETLRTQMFASSASLQAVPADSVYAHQARYFLGLVAMKTAAPTTHDATHPGADHAAVPH